MAEDKKYQIKGFEVKAELIKSRTAPAGRSVTMIFNQTEGFDNELSLLEFIKSNGALKGAGVSYYLEGKEDVKFRLSNFKDKLAENTEFRDYFYTLGRKFLKESISISGRFSVPDPEAEISMDNTSIEESEE